MIMSVRRPNSFDGRLDVLNIAFYWNNKCVSPSLYGGNKRVLIPSCGDDLVASAVDIVLDIVGRHVRSTCDHLLPL